MVEIILVAGIAFLAGTIFGFATTLSDLMSFLIETKIITFDIFLLIHLVGIIATVSSLLLLLGVARV